MSHSLRKESASRTVPAARKSPRAAIAAAMAAPARSRSASRQRVACLQDAVAQRALGLAHVGAGNGP